MSGWVYIVGGIGTGLVKIGFTKNPPQRIKALRVECPVVLLVLCLFEGTCADERVLHQKFSALRSWGEWFRIEPDNPIDAYIRERRTDPFLALHCDDYNEDGDWGSNVTDDPRDGFTGYPESTEELQ